ncbi:hypothetical protein CKO15_10225 [Halorhodospira abdelmalekii]|uniref:acyl carrier protein n=1 Tax=Halorhodospira abdelmalekii TaxID=421629 RepID=UPI0019043912|nr:acyl carrier protein [Halorhodospira abdelmalekii]MBK1735652.1 hypothetical protein [Halorhodospira abdelmalekii]
MTRSPTELPSREQLKTLILEATGKPMPTAGIPDDAPLFGADSVLELDSLDGLQISMAIQRELGLRITDPKALRRILQSIETLELYVHEQLSSTDERP